MLQHESSYIRNNRRNNDQSEKMEMELKHKEHSTRHQRLLRTQVTDLMSTTKQLQKSNQKLEDQMISIENSIKNVQNGNFEHYRTDDNLNENKPNNINNNDEDRATTIELIQNRNSMAIKNLTQQISNYDKLHISMLELLENVENVENKVDRSLPDFRKEISKLEFQLAQTETKVSALREDQTNTRDSVKAISVSVSNLIDKFGIKMKNIQDLNSTLHQLKESAIIQTAKLHDHILKVNRT